MGKAICPPLRLVKISRVVLMPQTLTHFYKQHTTTGSHALRVSVPPTTNSKQAQAFPSSPPSFSLPRRPPREPTTQETKQTRPTNDNHERRTTDRLRDAHRGPPCCQDPLPPPLQLCVLWRAPHGKQVSFWGWKVLFCVRCSTKASHFPPLSLCPPAIHVIPIVPTSPRVYMPGIITSVGHASIFIFPGSHLSLHPSLPLPYPTKNSRAPAVAVAGPTLPATTKPRARVGILSLSAGVAPVEGALRLSTTRRLPRV